MSSDDDDEVAPPSRYPRRRSQKKSYVRDDMSFSSGEQSHSSSSDDEEEEDQLVEDGDEPEEEIEGSGPTRVRTSGQNNGAAARRRSSRSAAAARKSYNEKEFLDQQLKEESEEEEEEEDDVGDEQEGEDSVDDESETMSVRSKPKSAQKAPSEGTPGFIPLPDENKPVQIETILARRKRYKHRDTDATHRRHQLIAAVADTGDDCAQSQGLNDEQEMNDDYKNRRNDANDEWEWEYLIKWKGYSYLHVSWETRETLTEIDPHVDRRIDRWVKKMEGLMANQGVDSQAASALGLNDDEDESEPFDPNYTNVERVLASNVPPGEDGSEALYLVKWCGLAYDECTWELGEDVCDDGAIKAFRQRQKLPSKQIWKPKPRPPPSKFKKLTESHEYGLGKTEIKEKPSLLKFEKENLPNEPFQLRNYQLEGLNWLIFNWYNNRGSILADEMGLGKTAQILTFFHYLATHPDTKNFGPFLVVAPLSTIEHWARETKVWGDGILDGIVYHGRSPSREVIRHNEFFYPDPESLQTRPAFPKLWKMQPNNPYNLSAPVYKFNVLITTYEMAMSDRQFLSQIPWQCIVIDEAHRLKNRSNRLYSDLQTYKNEHTILLTGTPIQNEIRELWALLHFLHPEGFPVTEYNSFLGKFGELRNSNQVSELHKVLRPYLLRRLKSDVDDTLKLPPKQETIVEVELTAVQKQYYRAIYERNTNFLMRGGTSTNAPNLMNVMMELRKCCNHPFLVHGVEENLSDEQLAQLQKQFQEKLANSQSDGEKNELKRAHSRAQAKLLAEQLVNTSGKMVLLDKLLPKFKQEGHRVLIFSQMVRMLDILQDYCTARRFGFERLDGRVRGPERQKAIDRFSDPDEDVFVMLLSTRAGGLGINLTAADTVIIFDSDWNPQNDLQAQARAHRIGQKFSVKIYRLITRKTYEQHMFHQASLKLGLDQAVIGGMREGSSKKQGQLGTKDVEGLLKRGAYDVFNEGEEGEKASQRFCEEDIDTILQRSTTVVWDGSGDKDKKSAEGSNQFSKASFVTSNSGEEVDLDDPEFWTKQIGLDAPTGAQVVEELGGGLMMNASGQVVDEDGNVIADRSRRRKQVARYGIGEEEDDHMEETLALGDESEGSYGPDDDDNTSTEGKGNKEKKGLRAKIKGRKHGISDEELEIAMSGGTQNLGLVDKSGWNLRKMHQEEQKIGASKWGNIESPWTAYERHKFHTAIWKFGWGRWHAIRLDGKLWKRTIPEIKIFARAYLQCAVYTARRALRSAGTTIGKKSEGPASDGEAVSDCNQSDSKDKVKPQKRNVFQVRLQNWMDRPMPGQRVMAEAEVMCPPVPPEHIPGVLLDDEFQTRLDADSALKLLERFDELMRLRDLVSIAAARYVRDWNRQQKGYPLRFDDQVSDKPELQDVERADSIHPPFANDISSYPSDRSDVTHADLRGMPWPKSGQNGEHAKALESWGDDKKLIFSEEHSNTVMPAHPEQETNLKQLPIIITGDYASSKLIEGKIDNILKVPHYVSEAIPSDKVPPQEDVPPHIVCDELLIEGIPRDELIRRIPILPQGYFSADTSRPTVSWWNYPYDDGHLVLACFLDGFGKVDTLATDPRLYYCRLLYEEYKTLPEEKKLPKVPRIVLHAKGRQRTALMLQAAKGYLDVSKAYFDPPPAPSSENEEDLREEIDIGLEKGEIPNEIRAAYLMISVQAINRHIRRLTHAVSNRSLTSRHVAQQLKWCFGGIYVPVTLNELPYRFRPTILKGDSRKEKEDGTVKPKMKTKKGTSKKSHPQERSRSNKASSHAHDTIRLNMESNVKLRLGYDKSGRSSPTVGHDCLEGIGGSLKGPAPRGKASVKYPGLVEYWAPEQAPAQSYSHDKNLKSACEQAIKDEMSKAQRYCTGDSQGSMTDTEMRRLCQWVYLGSCGKQNDLSGTSLADTDVETNKSSSSVTVRQDWGKMEKRRLESSLNRFGLPDERLHPLPAEYVRVINSFGVPNDEARCRRPFFTWKDLVAAAQLSKTPDVAYEYVMCSFLPHIMAIAAGSGGAHLELENESPQLTDSGKKEPKGKTNNVDDEDRKSMVYDTDEGEESGMNDETKGPGDAENSGQPRPSQYKRQYRGTRVLDPEIGLHHIGLTGRLFSRQLLTRISLINSVRWILNNFDFADSLAVFLRCSAFRKHISVESMNIHSNHSHQLLESAYTVNTSSNAANESSRELPTWWCPWVHDVELLRLVGRFGMNMGHSAGSFSRSKGQSVDNDNDTNSPSGDINVDSSWGWVRTHDEDHPFHPVSVRKHCWAVFFDENVESSITAQRTLNFMPPTDWDRLNALRNRLYTRFQSQQERETYVDQLATQWPTDSLLEARIVSLATHLSPFRSALPRVLGPVSRVTLPAQRQDVLAIESREEILRSLWSEAVEEQWGWSESDSWAFLADVSPSACSLRREAGWWQWGTRFAPCVFPAEEQWSAWGNVRGNASNFNIWGISAGHLPSSVFVPKALVNNGDSGSVVDAARARYLSKVYIDENINGDSETRKRPLDSSEDHKMSKSRKLTASHDSDGSYSSDLRQTNGDSENMTFGDEQRGYRDYTAVVDPFFPLASDCSKAELLASQKSEDTPDRPTEKKMHSSLRVLNVLYNSNSGNPNAPPSWPPNQGHSWLGIGEKANLKRNIRLTAAEDYDCHVSWRGYAGTARPFDVPPPVPTSANVKSLSKVADVAVHLPSTLYKEYRNALPHTFSQLRSMHNNTPQEPFLRSESHADIAENAAKKVSEALSGESRRVLPDDGSLLSAARTALSGENVSTTRRFCPEYDFIAKQCMELVCSREGKEPKRADRRTARGVASAVWSLVQAVAENVEGKSSLPEHIGGSSDGYDSEAHQSDRSSSKGKVTGKKRKRHDVSLKDLIDHGFLEPGKEKLEIKFRGNTFKADLGPDGFIIHEGTKYSRPSSWSLPVKRRVIPDKQTDDGWYSIKVGQTPLITLKHRYVEQNLESS